LAWGLLGLIFAWNVAGGSLMSLPNTSAAVGLANIVFILGAGFSLWAHELAQRGVAHLMSVREPTVRELGGHADARTTPAAEPVRPAAEMAAAAVGPIVGVFLALGVIIGARLAFVAGAADPLIRALAGVVSFNVLLAVANLVPALPLDGGRLLRAAVAAVTHDRRRAARVAGAVTEAVGLLALAAALASAWFADLADGLSWLFVAIVVLAEGRAERQAAEEDAETPQAPTGRLAPGRSVFFDARRRAGLFRGRVAGRRPGSGASSMR
jgi:Zn-dependent protease